MKTVFEWCERCAFFKHCYSDGSPHYLEPACGCGPATMDESEEVEND